MAAPPMSDDGTVAPLPIGLTFLQQRQVHELGPGDGRCWRAADLAGVFIASAAAVMMVRLTRARSGIGTTC